ncbi:MAG: 16S rRNA (cytidine(1402)-2'-O)-methyltransferase [Actinobacteria bacterium]|nr:16S rRNA (cytidine(1402)-2'-O)-methyltransferase [Actinomycetota bacterium]
MKQKIQEKVEKKGTLYIVPTPIGNLKDITLRAIEVLKNVDFIFAEDTRETIKLLRQFGIKTEVATYLGGYHKKIEEILRLIFSGKDIAIVSDRGTPCVNDPGYELVAKAYENKVKVVPLPGPNAAITALEASGFPTDEFFYLGFFPKKGKQRKSIIEFIARERRTVVFYESPKRLLSTLKDLQIEIGDDRFCFIARELTKAHEELIRGRLSEVIEKLQSRSRVLGEFVVVLGPSEKIENLESEAVKLARLLTNEGLQPKKAAKIASNIFNVKQRVIYEYLLRD